MILRQKYAYLYKFVMRNIRGKKGTTGRKLERQHLAEILREISDSDVSQKLNQLPKRLGKELQLFYGS